MLKETELIGRGGGDTRSSELHHVTRLKDLGLDKQQSHRYQKISDLPEETFETLIIEMLKETELSKGAATPLHDERALKSKKKLVEMVRNWGKK